MAILSLSQLKEHLAFTHYIGGEDDAVLTRLIDAAQNHAEQLMGCKIEEQFGGVDQDPIPPALV
ncbi:hypothetical protein RUESEDTHA_00838 [Ruegeria sp. THAF57]|nr:hypothetical protein RUESEDTHA_00838 [Ruegeria sp. THAF57]